MGQKKSVKEEDNSTLLDKYVDMLRNIKGHYMSLTISTAKEDENTWKAKGKMKIGSSMDGEHWGELEMSVMGFDVNSDSALATVMVSLNNYINSPEFVVEMGNRMVDSMDKQPQIPDVVTS